MSDFKKRNMQEWLDADFETVSEWLKESYAELDTLRKRVAELEAEKEWRPISEAPRDGSGVLTWSEYNGFNVDNFCGNEHRFDWNWGEPTHYQPLPTPPAAQPGVKP